jgi:conjugal transfer pilus assembly protein TraB
MQKNNPLSSQQVPSQSFPYPAGQEEEKNLIQKVSLGLTENLKHKLPKTVDTTIPAGAFAKTVLLSGLDASSAMTASSDPRPMLLRLIDPGTLPRRFQSDLKDCHCTASAYGDLSSERVYARLEKLTCIERTTGEIIETQVAGYIAGSDGKAGIRGVVASKDGQFLGRSLVGGIFAGLSNVANPQNRQAQVNPFAMGGKQPSPPNIGDMFTAGMTSGVSTALDRLSQYYIDRAEQLQPVIQIAAGQVVDIVFTQGTFIGSQDVKEQIEGQRENQPSSMNDHQN